VNAALPSDVARVAAPASNLGPVAPRTWPHAPALGQETATPHTWPPPAPAGTNLGWPLKAIFAVLLLPLIQQAKPLLLPIVVAVVFTLMLAPLVRRLRRIGINESIGAAIVIVIALAGVAGLAQAVAAPATAWWDRAPESIKQLSDTWERLRRSYPLLSAAAPFVTGAPPRSAAPATGRRDPPPAGAKPAAAAPTAVKSTGAPSTAVTPAAAPSAAETSTGVAPAATPAAPTSTAVTPVTVTPAAATPPAPAPGPAPRDGAAGPATGMSDKLASEGIALTRTVVTSASAFALTFGATIMLLYFLLASERWLIARTMQAIPRRRARALLLSGVRRAQRDMSYYFATQLFINCGVGVAVGLSSWWLGLPNPGLWGVVAGLLNFIPYLGPLMTAVLMLLAGLLTFQDFGDMIAPTVALVCVHAVESNVVSPLVMGRRLELSPLAVFVSVLLWGWLWGLAGSLIAVPVLLVVRTVCRRVRGLRLWAAYLDRGREAPSLRSLLRTPR
jgi:predicted PurR-regulated permease PerM